MNAAPAPIIDAAHETLHLASAYIRSQLLNLNNPIRATQEIMEATHYISNMTTNWNKYNLKDIRDSFALFDHSRWPGSPDLLSHFDRRLKEITNAA